MSITPVNTAQAAQTNTKSQGTIAASFDQFLTLLTTQLQNQNPLDPLDTNQFTQQLVQFSGVEQQLKTNTQLETLVAQNKASHMAMAANFIGTTITADGATASLSDDKAQWSLKSASAGTAIFTVTNQNNQTVYTETRSLVPGQQSFLWNGRDQNKVKLPAGEYKLSIAAKDANGRPVTVSTEIEGQIDQVRFEGDRPILLMGGQAIPYERVRTIRNS
jgi:flagellar basal-body rod modification protein FlgD